LTASAGGTIGESGALTVTDTPTFTVTSSNSDILLADAANNFTTTPVITDNDNLRDLALRNISATAAVSTLPASLRNLTLIFNNNGLTLPAVTLNGNLSLTAGGNILQSGAAVMQNAGTT